MGRAYIKPEAHVDFYIIWSSITDAPVYWGSERKIMKFEKKMHGSRSNMESLERRVIDAIYRADATSCSDRIGSYEWYEDYEFNYLGEYTIKRSNLRRLVKFLGKGYNPISSEILALTEEEVIL